MRLSVKIAFVALCLLQLSCSGEGEKKRVLVASKGLPSELLLVADEKVWNSDLKDSLNAIVEAQVPGLMQAEKLFRVTSITSRNYSPTHTTFHTKLLVKLDRTLKAPLMGIKRNEYAVPQLELLVAAPSVDTLRSFLSQNADRIQEILTDFQIEKRVAQLKKKYSKMVYDRVKNHLGWIVHAPENMQATKQGVNFLWAGTNLVEKDLNLVLYTCNWSGEDLTDPLVFANLRDSVMQKNVPGERPDQWMQTVREGEQNLPLVQTKVKMLDGRNVVEARGLWEMRNGALGGPFVCIASVDTIKKEVALAEGFVYSPSTEKRDLVRTMEAVLRTVRMK